MEITKEFAEQIQLNDTQIKAIFDATEAHEADLKKGWDSKANENANAILDDVAKGIETMTGVKREPGQKHKDYLSIASESYLKTQKSDLERQKTELQEKIKNGQVDELTKKELSDVKAELAQNKIDLDKYKEKAAKFDDWEKNDYKGKYESTLETLTKTQENVAFQSVKPSFPDSVNKYESSAKWNDFISGVKEKNRIVEENGKYYAIDKENEHKKVELSSLVEKDKTIQGLLQGRNFKGFSDKEQKTQKIEGVPFDIPENATASDIQKAVKDYISTELKLLPTSQAYAKKFGELYSKIKAQQTA